MTFGFRRIALIRLILAASTPAGAARVGNPIPGVNNLSLVPTPAIAPPDRASFSRPV